MCLYYRNTQLNVVGNFEQILTSILIFYKRDLCNTDYNLKPEKMTNKVYFEEKDYS